MRITPRRLVISCLISLAFVCLIHYVSQMNKWKKDPSNCLHGPGDLKRLIFLAEHLHKTLQLLGTQHFLCYESLWGALYNEGPRTWDWIVEFCLIGPELFSDQDEGIVAKTFKSQGLVLQYDVLDGSYTVRLTDGPHVGLPDASESDVSGRLIPFRSGLNKPPKFMRRSGLKRAVLPEDCDNQLLECFPAHLALLPLPLIKYGTLSLPAPREGMEIQKYHYPDDWWLQRKIPPC